MGQTMASTPDDAINWDVIREGFSSISIEPLSKDPHLLGQPDVTTSIDHNHPFAKMGYATTIQRPAQLRGVHSEEKEFQYKTVKKVFAKIWDGEFQIDWQERWNNDIENDGLYLCVVADKRVREKMVTEDKLIDGKYVLSIALKHMREDLLPTETHFENNVGISGYVTGINPLIPYLTVPQRDSLCRRVIHHFLRQHGNLLSLFSFDQMFIHLFQYFIQENWYSEAVDISMVMLDRILFLETDTTHPNQVIFMNKLGESLEGAGRYSDAIVVYSDTGEYYGGLTNRCASIPRFSNVNRSQMWANAGFANKRAINYAESERCYVKALWTEVNQHERSGIAIGTIPLTEWRIDEESAKLPLNNLIQLYFTWHIVQYLLQARLVTEGEVPDVSVLDKRGYPILNGLVEFAGIQIRSERDDLIAACIQQIKNKFVATPAAAKGAIYKALLGDDPSVETFRSKLFLYHNTKRKDFKIRKVDDPQKWKAKLGIDREGRKYVKDIARETATVGANAKDNDYGIGQCDQCKLTFSQNRIQLCPCKMVGFCGRDCQILHWKAGHRNTCTAKRKKNSN